jgi:hypothetical protein
LSATRSNGWRRLASGRSWNVEKASAGRYLAGLKQPVVASDRSFGPLGSKPRCLT